MSFAKFLGTGSSAPDKVLSNFDFEKMIDTSDEWIRTRTGIEERRIAEPEVATSDLAYEASLKALEDASVDISDIDGIIVGTITPDHIFPSSACLLQSRLGARQAFAFDLLAGCSGFMYALHTAKGLIEGGDSKKTPCRWRRDIVQDYELRRPHNVYSIRRRSRCCSARYVGYARNNVLVFGR